MRTDSFFVLTGGPGSGKTSLIEALREAGLATCPEAGRGVIRDQVAIGGPALPWLDPARFAELMLAWDMRNHAEAAEGEPVFFDRGVVDSIGYLRLCNLPVPGHISTAAAAFRYARRVFALPPWPEIYTRDAERKQDLEEAERTYTAVTGAYRDFGYELVEMPRATIAERLRFVGEVVGRQE